MKTNMQQIILYFLLFSSIFLSCQTGYRMKEFISGTYVREFKNEFYAGRDTLVIWHFNNSTYLVNHKESFQRIRDGRLLNVERKLEKWVTVYDEKEQILKEERRGRILSFDPSKNILMVGSSIYKKLK